MYGTHLGAVVGPGSDPQTVHAVTVTNPSATSSVATGGNVWSNISQGLVNIGTVLVGLQAQKRLASINLERAKQGLAPLTMDQAGVTPTIKTVVDVPPEYKAQTQQIGKYLLLGGGIAVIAAMLLSGKKKA